MPAPIKFSRKPMHVHRYRDAPSEFVISQDDWLCLAIAYGSNEAEHCPEKQAQGEANAHLMAAANKLYAALELILEDPEALAFRPRTAKKVYEAMAEARGEKLI